VFHNGYGDCKDQTALLTTLLRAAGFQAYPVLASPGEDLVWEVPLPVQFIHEFTAVETGMGLMFLDTAVGPAQPQTLLPGVRGRSALLVGASGASRIEIPLETPVPTSIAEDLKGTVNAGGGFEGSVQLEFGGLMEALLRRLFLDGADADKEKALLGLMGAEFRGATVSRIESGDATDLSRPFQVRFGLSKKDFFAPGEGSLKVTLGWSGWAFQGPDESAKPDRPVPLDAIALSTKMDLAIDTSFTITEGLPLHRKTRLCDYDSEFSYEDGRLLLRRTFSLRAAMLQPSDWEEIHTTLREARDESKGGFTLSRLRNSTSPSFSTSGVGGLLQEGRTAYDRRDYEGARKAYLKATQLDPKSLTAWNSLGRAYAALHLYTQAEAAYKRQIEINERDPNAYNNLGLVYRALKRDEEAIECFKKQIAINAEDRFAHQNLALAYIAKGEWEKARAESAIAVQISPTDAAKWVQLGRVQLRTDRAAEARQSFDRALSMQHDPMDENNIAFYLADAGLDFDKSWKLASRALDSEAALVCEPDALSNQYACAAQLRRLSYMLDTAGWVLYRQGKIADAEPYLRSAYAITPRLDMALHLAVISAKTGHADDGVKYFAEAQTRAGFERADTREARQALAKALGGEAQLDARLKALSAEPAESRARVLVLVDGKGKVMGVAGGGEGTPAAVLELAKALTFAPVSWPGHSFRTVRAAEFRQDGGVWSLDETYVGVSPEASVAR